MQTIIAIILAILALITSTVSNVRYHADTMYEEQYSQEEANMPQNQQTFRVLTPSQALEKMQANPDAIILDVRTQDEFDQERIPGAILLPDFEVEARAREVLPDKDALILIYCRSGRRSNLSAKLLASMGYTNVYDFGGILSWPYDTAK